MREYVGRFEKAWPGSLDGNAWEPALYRTLYLAARHYGSRRHEWVYLIKWLFSSPGAAAVVAGQFLKAKASR